MNIGVIMPELNEKQIEMLNKISDPQLKETIYGLIRDYNKAESKPVAKNILASKESIRSIEKEYNTITKIPYFYDYYEADGLFEELYSEVAVPLDKLSCLLPEETEILSRKVLLDFERLSENTDSSSGSWMAYYYSILETWLTSLACQEDKGCEVIVDKITDVLQYEHYFDCSVFNQHKDILGTDIMRALRTRFFKQGKINDAVELSIYIRDIDFIRNLLRKGKIVDSGIMIEYAELLTNEACADEAVTVLESIRDNGYIRYQNKWNELYSRTLIAVNRLQEARESCLEGFKYNDNILFFEMYPEIDGLKNKINLFSDIARQKGLLRLIRFFSEIDDYENVDHELKNAGKSEIIKMLTSFKDPFFRSLSSKLFNHGYAYSATLLCRILVDDCINYSKSHYYEYAASDMKKGIEYSRGLVWDKDVPPTKDYFYGLYDSHKRKRKLWSVLQKEIEGLSIKNNHLFYLEPVKRTLS